MQESDEWVKPRAGEFSENGVSGVLALIPHFSPFDYNFVRIVHKPGEIQKFLKIVAVAPKLFILDYSAIIAFTINGP